MAAPDLTSAPRFTVIVPTHARRDLVVRLVGSLGDQTLRDLEAVVVVDGGADGTADALRALELPFPLTVIEQEQQGPAAARNAGAAVAHGELLLFLDDDMAPSSDLLAEHDRWHRDGVQVVLGHLPLDPASPRTAVAAAVGRWAERRAARLAAADGNVPVPDLLTGQLSIARADFERLRGFDTGFAVMCEDLDFGYRARKAGLRIAFNPDAVSRQYYDIDAHEYTRRSRVSARAMQSLAALHPEVAGELWRPQFSTPWAKLTLGPLTLLPRPLSAPLRAVSERLFSRPEPGSLSNRLFFAVQTMERRRGAREEERALQAPVAVVLAYHSISSLAGDPILEPYGVPPDGFAHQLDRLLADGWSFVALEQFLRGVTGVGALPERAVLLTFDDAYVDLLTSACPILSERGIPAVVFVVGDRIGGTNAWERSAARELRLLDGDGLREVAARGVAVQSHGATHHPLVDVPPAELERELVGSADRIEAIGLPRPTVLSYPHGAWNDAVAEAAERVGYRAAFTVAPGGVRRLRDVFALPRIEVLADDTPQTVARKARRFS